MAEPISPEQMAIYRSTARQRQQQYEVELAERHRRAWEVAQQAGQLLKADFQAQKVAVFGSILTPGRFHERSDVDLAVWGLAEPRYYRAVSRLLDLDPIISVDLVEAEFASPGLMRVIEREGVLL
jgi:predicted nucleotidyltransferase